MTRKSLAVLCLVLFVVLGSAQTRTWIPLGGEPETQPDIQIIASDDSRTTVELTLPGIYVEDITAQGQQYQRLFLPVRHAGEPSEVGSPNLPVVARLIAVPPRAGIDLALLEADEVVRTGFNIYPLQPSQREDKPPVPFTKDESRDASDAVYPEQWARLSEPAIWRDYRVVSLILQPVRCNPKTGELRIARRLRVELRYRGLGTNPKEHSRPFISRTFLPLYQAHIANFDFLPPTSPLTGSYLIIAHDSFYDDVRPLADWKQRKGWRTKLVRTSEIGGQDSAHVYNYIHDGYLNWPYPIDYVCLVGDVEFITHCRGLSGVATDHAYTKHEGNDYLSEVLVARISVKTHAECQTVVNKLVAYENDPYLANPDWFHKATTIGGYESGWPDRFWTCCIQVRNELLAHSPITQVDTLFQRWGLATPTNVTNAINEGRSWLLYRGHGDVDGWYNVSPAWVNSHVQALSNGRMTPMVVAPTCLSGRYNDPNDCHAETWLKTGTPSQARGGIGYFGSSEPSYTGHNDSLALGTFVGYCESLNFSMAQSTYNGKLYMYRAYPPPNQTTQQEFDMFNNFGEPDLGIYSGTPAELLVNHPATVRIGSSQFPVEVSAGGPVANALVCVMCRQDTSIWQNAFTDGSGTALFTLNCTRPGDSLLVTVTGRNLRAYLGAALVIATNSPYVTHLRHAINDPEPGGNGDGIVNPGEAITLPTWFKNWGSAPAQSVTAVLRSADPMVLITDSLRSLGDIAPGESVYTGPGGFGFTVSSSCTNGYALRFTLVCRDNRDSVWTSPFSILCGTAALSYAGRRVYDPPPGGNGNQRIDPGETVELFMNLTNTGLGHGYGVRAILRSGDTRFRVRDSVSSYGTILRDSTREGQNGFIVEADASIMPETAIPCTLAISADGGYQRLVSVTVMIGELRNTDPIHDNAEPPVYWAYDDADSGYAQRPIFNWIELRGRGTRLSLSDDQTVQISLPPQFGPWKYYGQRYTSISICSNGWIAAGTTTS
ncbi:MAG: C25 family cysteine peptidase, partial [candidate division WOR-3 bacterium]